MRYREDDINQILESLNKIPQNVSLKQIHQLVVPKNFGSGNPFSKSIWNTKMITMLSTMGIIITTSMLWIFWDLAATEDQSVSNIKQSKDVETNMDFSDMDYDLPAIRKWKQAIQVQRKNDLQIERGLPEVNGKSFKKLNAYRYQSDYGWPADTVIDGRLLMIELSLDELERLGFTIVQNDNGQSGIFYNNEFEGIVSAMHFEKRRDQTGSYGSSSVPSVGVARKNIKKQVSTNDYYPIVMSDFTLEPLGSPIYLGKDWRKNWKVSRDTLVPISLKRGLVPNLIDEAYTLWMKTSNSFFEDLPSRYEHLAGIWNGINQLRVATGRTDIVSYEGPQIISSMNVLELPDEALRNLGFEFTSDNILYSQTETDSCKIELKLGMGTGVSMGLVEDQKSTPYQVVFLSNEKGRQQVKWVCSGDTDHEKFSDEYFLDKHETLVPVVLRKSRFADILFEDMYLWFEPTPDFLQMIPGEEGELIRKEYELLVARDTSIVNASSCSFFEACRATLHIHDLNLYPNPTRGVLNTKLSMPNELYVNISISDMNGREILQLKKGHLLNEGLNDFRFDVSQLPSGMYLFVIHGGNGFISKRLLIEK